MVKNNPQLPQAKDVTTSSANPVALAEVVPPIPSSFKTKMEEFQKKVFDAENETEKAKSGLDKVKKELKKFCQKKAPKGQDVTEEFKSLVKKIESGEGIDTPETPSLHESYSAAHKTWKQAKEKEKKAEEDLETYSSNIHINVPEVMIEVKALKANLPEIIMQCLREFTNQQFFSNITPPFNGQNQEVDIVFPVPVDARYITFKPKTWNGNPYLRCEVYVNGELQNTPLSQRSTSSFHNGNNNDSTMGAQYGWMHKSPYNQNQWLRLDLQQCKTITGIRVGTYRSSPSVYVSNLELEFGS